MHWRGPGHPTYPPERARLPLPRREGGTVSAAEPSLEKIWLTPVCVLFIHLTQSLPMEEWRGDHMQLPRALRTPLRRIRCLSLYPDRHLYAKLNSKVNKCHDFEHRLYHLSSAKTLYFLFDLSSILFPCLFGPMITNNVVFSLKVVVPISAPKRQYT